VHASILRAPAGEVKPPPGRRAFAALPHDLAGDPRLSPTDKAVLLALLFWARDKDHCWPSNTSIAARIGRGVDTVQRRLAHLEDLGIVRRQPATNRTGRLIVLLWRAGGEAAPMRPRPAAPMRPEGDVIVKGETENFRGEDLPQRQRSESEPLAPPSVVEASPVAATIPAAVPESPAPPAVHRETTPAPPPASAAPPPAPETLRSVIPPPRAARTAQVTSVGLTPDQQNRLAELPEATRDQVLTWLALGDPILRGEAGRLLAPRRESRPIEGPKTVPELIERLGESPGYPIMGASWLARELGDVKSQAYYQKVLTECWAGTRSPESVLDAYRQATNPKAKKPGAIFAHALKRLPN
jgi:hypothetical protein